MGNFKNLLRSSFPLLMAALGQMLIILTGGTDLSLGGIAVLYNVVYVLSMNSDSAWGFVPALRVAAAAGLACGAANGVLVTKGRLAPIIVIIATTAVLDGMALLLISNPGGGVHKAFTKFLTRGYSGVAPFPLFILIPCLMRRLTNNTSYGKVLRTIGGSENAAYSTGVRVGKIKFRAYRLAEFLCAVAGVFLSIQVNSADVATGKNYAMNAITAAMVGGTAMMGTVEDPLGTMAGVSITSIINNILSPFGVPPSYQFICQDLILIAAPSPSVLHKRCWGLWGLIT